MIWAIHLFPLMAIVVSGFALWIPDTFIAMKPAIIPLLGLVMLGMGVTLTPGDFRQALSRPKILLLGLCLQFAIMPLMAWLISESLGLGLLLSAGLILVGSCPGGTASNVICYLSGGNTALSITLTTLSTLFAVVLTPLLTWFYIGQRIPVPVWDMLESIARIILLPVGLGVLLNYFFGRHLTAVKALFPVISMLAIVLIIGIIMGLNHQRVPDLALGLGVAVVFHNLSGLGLTYLICRLIKLDEQTTRTLSIEVGMQNSGLAVALAVKYYSLTAALPGALFSIWHNLSGSLLAAIWARNGVDESISLPGSKAAGQQSDRTS